MSDQTSWHSFGIAIGATAGVFVVVILAGVFILSFFAPKLDIQRGWGLAPFGKSEIERLAVCSDVQLVDDESRFMLIASEDLSVDAIRVHDIFEAPLIGPLTQQHAGEKGPLIAGTLDGRSSFFLELPPNFRAVTSHSRGGYLIKPTRNPDGTILLILMDPNH